VKTQGLQAFAAKFKAMPYMKSTDVIFIRCASDDGSNLRKYPLHDEERLSELADIRKHWPARRASPKQAT
jgi:hypothetical protein